MKTNAAGGAPDVDVIRPAAAEDAPSLARLAERTFRETFAADNTPEDLEQYVRGAFGDAIQRRELEDPDVETLLVEVGGRLAGYAQLWDTPAPAEAGVTNALELRRFYVDRPWHGRGVAQKLMAAVKRA